MGDGRGRREELRRLLLGEWNQQIPSREMDVSSPHGWWKRATVGLQSSLAQREPYGFRDIIMKTPRHHTR